MDFILFIKKKNLRISCLLKFFWQVVRGGGFLVGFFIFGFFIFIFRVTKKPLIN